MGMFFSKLKLLWDEYKSILVVMFTSLGFCEFLDAQKLLQFLLGLNDAYGQVLSQVLLMKPLTNLNTAFSMMLNEENHWAITSSTPLGDEFFDSLTTLYSGNTGTKIKRDVTCFYCGKKAHRADVCYKKKKGDHATRRTNSEPINR